MTVSKDNGIRPAARRKARRFALQGLYEWSLSGNVLNEIETRYKVENDMHKVDLDYFHELLHEIPACTDELDAKLAPCLDRAPEELTPVEHAILRIGAYELIRRVDVPYRVAINEAIELSKLFGANDAHKFINGVLDKLAKDVRAVEVKADRG